MRNVFTKVLTSATVVGAALLVAACGGTENAEGNAASADINAMDATATGTTNDVTAIDAATGAGGNMAGDMNMSMNTSDMGGNMSGGMTGGNMSGGNMTGGNMSGGGNMTGTTGNTM